MKHRSRASIHIGSVLCFSLLATVTALCQNTWTVSNDPGFAADFSTVQAAIDAASPGDKIYVHGSSIAYPSFIVNKRLHLVGAGYWKAVNGIDDNNIESTTITGAPGTPSAQIQANSSILEGFNVLWMTIHQDSVIVRYNHIGGSTYGIQFVGTPNNAFVYGNYINYGFNGSAANANIYNNIIPTGNTGGSLLWSSNASNINCVLQNNAFGKQGATEGRIGGVTVRNGILDFADFLFTGPVVLEHNVMVDDTIGGVAIEDIGTGNIGDVDISTIWDYANPSPDGKYQLIGDSTTNVAFGAGINGEDCGAFGGDSPYRLSGIVKVPTIYYMQIPLVGDTTNMLKVKIRAKSN